VKLKLDENLSRRAADLLRAAGHDVLTVADQGLGGITDERLFEVCVGETRALITLDRDFGQVLRFPPEASAGIVVIEIGPQATHTALLNRMRDLVSVLRSRSPNRQLWVVEPRRMRIHLHNSDE
jgi:predicted nuclease of predicted toxin-antitoxin system